MNRLASLAIIATGAIAYAAPVPPPPKLTEKMLVGEWRYQLAGISGAKIVFRPDGTYTATYAKDVTNEGTWSVDRGEVVLIEWLVSRDGCEPGPQLYRFRLNPQTLSGQTEEGFPVALKKLAP